jgi:hypothetical protein
MTATNTEPLTVRALRDRLIAQSAEALRAMHPKQAQGRVLALEVYLRPLDYLDRPLSTRRIVGIELADQTVPIDGHEYVGVEFNRCILVFTGLGPTWSLHGCDLDGSAIKFDGPASETVDFLRAMYHDGAEAFVEQVIALIKTPPGEDEDDVPDEAPEPWQA